MKRLILILAFLPVVLVAEEPVRDDPGALAAAGNVAWRANDKGAAVLNWERAIALSADQSVALTGLALAKDSGAKSAEFSLTEHYATALPSRDWLMLLTVAFWTTTTSLLLAYLFPALRRREIYLGAGFAASLALLTLPGIAGKTTASHRAVILKSEATLRLTPTTRGEPTGTRAVAGDRVRITDRENGFLRIITADGSIGWVAEKEAASILRRGS